MRSVTSPEFPAQVEGAVTLQALIDAREGDRLPLDLALYVSGELGKQVAQLQAIGKEGSLDPKRVWCTSKGAVTVHQASAGESHDLGPLIYQLLSGSGNVSAWPPSYFNPSVGESLDAAVMSAVSGEGSGDTRSIVQALDEATTGLDQEASVTGMARLVFAVADEPRPIAAFPAARVMTVESTRAPIVTAPRRRLPLALAVGILLAGAIGLLTARSNRTDVAVALEPVAIPAVSPAQSLADGSSAEPSRGPKPGKNATASARTPKKGKTK